MPTFSSKQFLLIPLSLLVLAGCSTAKHSVKNNSTPILGEKISVSVPKGSETIAQENKPEEKKSIVFFKTDFRGLLQANYVKLTITSTMESIKEFDLHLGDISNEILFKSGQRTIKPGYIYLELPQGEYRIATVSILVGTTLAAEDINLTFTVKPDVVNYLGTLSLDGTRERIKLGGVPVIKPGFNYELEIKDDHEEALKDFQQKFPGVKTSIDTGLLHLEKNDQT